MSRLDLLNSFQEIDLDSPVERIIRLDVCKKGRIYTALEGHKIILQHLIAQEPDKAGKAMQNHLQDTLEYSRSLKPKVL